MQPSYGSSSTAVHCVEASPDNPAPSYQPSPRDRRVCSKCPTGRWSLYGMRCYINQGHDSLEMTAAEHSCSCLFRHLRVGPETQALPLRRSQTSLRLQHPLQRKLRRGTVTDVASTPRLVFTHIHKSQRSWGHGSPSETHEWVAGPYSTLLSSSINTATEAVTVLLFSSVHSTRKIQRILPHDMLNQV
jgi:hypothetical protein